jgi:hypothetical protein
MPSLNDKETLDIVDQLIERNDRIRRESLEKSKLEAVIIGKEKFDYVILRQYVDPDQYIGIPSPEERVFRLEYKYYVELPQIMTLKEFSEFIFEMYKWRD